MIQDENKLKAKNRMENSEKSTCFDNYISNGKTREASKDKSYSRFEPNESSFRDRSSESQIKLQEDYRTINLSLTKIKNIQTTCILNRNSD